MRLHKPERWVLSRSISHLQQSRLIIPEYSLSSNGNDIVTLINYHHVITIALIINRSQYHNIMRRRLCLDVRTDRVRKPLMGRDQAVVRELRREHVSLAREKEEAGKKEKGKKREEGGRGIVNKEAKDPKVITSGRSEIEREENVRDIDVHFKGSSPLAIGHIMHQHFLAGRNLSCAGFLGAVLAWAALTLATLVALALGSGAFAATAEGKLGGC
jgi:hypothetical protein